MSEFVVGILIPAQIRARSIGQQFFNLLARYFPECLPERFGTTEPLRNRFDLHDMGLALSSWGALNFIAQRRHPRSYFMVSFWPIEGKDPRHSSITFFHVEADAESVCQFVEDTCQIFRADYAFAHPLTQPELYERMDQIKERMENGPSVRVEVSERLKRRIENDGYASLKQDELAANIERVTRVARGGPEVANRQIAIIKRRIAKQGFASVLSTMVLTKNHTVYLRKNLRDLYGLNFFGCPYVDMFGPERLSSAPAAQIHQFKNGFSLRIAEKLENNGDSWADFKAARNRCKSHLNRNAFFIPGAAAGHNYRAPTFVFTSDSQRPT